MRTEREEIPALGASAYLLVCRRHATLLALCNTHSGRRGAGGVWVVLTVASCRPAAAAAAAAAQHVTPLDHITACRAAIGPCPFSGPVGRAACRHHCGPSPRRGGRLGHEHRDARCGAGCHGHSQRCAGRGGLGAGSRLTFVIWSGGGLGVQRGVGVREGAGATGWETCKDGLQNQAAEERSKTKKTIILCGQVLENEVHSNMVLVV